MKDKEILRNCHRLEKTQSLSHDDRMQCDMVGCVLEWEKDICGKSGKITIQCVVQVVLYQC